MTLSWPKPGIPNVELGLEEAEVGLGLGVGPTRSPRSSLQRSVVSIELSPKPTDLLPAILDHGIDNLQS